ncbi:MAG: hypothetical protein J3Q66DRAFT_438231 [Benniella sp.]|nr:MAG: hypothetical protein J3Q66DRAFT_438231 [Benniella sp.]
MSSPFEGKVIQLKADGYDGYAHQYASSTLKDAMKPALILYAINDDDVIKAILFAHGSKTVVPRAMSIRSGGHHYVGASSTSGNNMTVDLSFAYDDFVWKDSDYTRVKVGVGHSLANINNLLKGAGRFVPHGQCSYVYVGGHCQSGGYGQFIRSFGLMVDYVQKYRLITADGQIIKVRRDSKDPKIQDLFYALAGGSPGNFGIVTHVTLKVLKDQDYRKSYGYRCEAKYSRDLLEKLFNYVIKMDTDNRSADYDLCITFGSTREQPGNEVSTIIVFAQFANRWGPNDCDQGFFQGIRDICKGHILPTDDGGFRVTDESLPLSELGSHWLFPVAREFEYPFIKRGYITSESGDYLNAQGWTKWASGRIDEIESAKTRTCYISAQFQYTGGRGATESAMKKNDAKGETSISWRDSTFIFSLDIFYKPEGEQTAKHWQQQNDHDAIQMKKFSTQDRRYIWAPHSPEDVDLIAARKFFFDSDDKFDRLVAIKNRVDPHGLLTPNKFCVTSPTVFHGPLPSPTQAQPPLHLIRGSVPFRNVEIPSMKGSKFMTREAAKL